MKKLILIGLIALNGAIRALPPFTNGLLASWEFTGNYLDGWGPYNPNGGVMPTFTADRCGNANNAVSFNGTNQYIQTSLLWPIGSSARSISFWIKTTNNQLGPRAVFDYGNSTGTGVGDAWQIVFNYCSQGIGLDVSDQAIITGGSCLSDGGWHHVAAVYSAASSVYTTTVFYIDGVQAAISCNVSGTTQTVNTGWVYSATIGRGASSAVRYFQGELDDIYFYNRALTLNEVQQLFNYNCGGVTGNTCFCNEVNVFTTPPVAGATSYVWSLPAGWQGSSNSNAITVTAGSGSGNVMVTITTGCGGTIVRTLPNYVYCNNTAQSLNLGASNVTLCTNAATSAVITATSANDPNTTFTWVPSNITGPNLTVSPAVTTVYTVTASSPPDFCPDVATVTVYVTEDCCSFDIDDDMYVLPPNASGTYNGGTYLVNSNVTLGGNTSFVNAEFVFKPNVQVTVPAGVNLQIDGAHLYACGIRMWQGIVVQDMGSINSGPSGVSSLIEDAITAIDLSGVSPSFVSPPIDLTDVTFNKNYIGINISNVDPAITTLPLRLLGCVFSSRSLPFTSTTWPSSSTADLRLAVAAATAGIVAPYLMQNYAQSNLKIPFSNQGGYAGIVIDNVGNIPASPTSAGVDIGVTHQGTVSDFNLFDGLGVGIEVTDASLTTMNNVFQNMKYNGALNNMSGTGIRSRILSPVAMNARLDLRPVGASNQATDFGNRFWECYTGVFTENVFEFDIEYGIFRSNHLNSGKSFVPGYDGIRLNSNRFDYNTRFCEFNNITYGITIDNQAAFYDMGNGPGIGIYCGDINIEENYFGPQVNSMAPLNGEFVWNAIQISGPNSPVYQLASGTSEAKIYSNKIDRSFNGVSVNSMFDYPIQIGGNNINIVDEFPISGNMQHGVEAYDNQGNLRITDNALSSTGILNPMVHLVYCRDNQGGGSPIVNCNNLNDSYIGFDFEGNNGNASWKGNTMKNHEYGMVLRNNGVIGTQGTPFVASGNAWNGTWSAPGFETYCINSNANLSPLYVTASAPYYPNSNTGSGMSTPYAAGASLWVIKRGGNYQCPSTSYPPVPSQKVAITTGISGNADPAGGHIVIYPNPATQKINVSGLTPGSKTTLRIFDLTGKKVFESQVFENSETKAFELQLSKGIYLAELNSDEQLPKRTKLIIE